jgi:hypothetical protein
MKQFSLEQLRREIGDFYKVMGDKRYWQNGKIHKCFSAIATVYLNTELSADAANAFLTASTEYTRRCSYMELYNIQSSIQSRPIQNAAVA